ncbi:MAG: hypothetical protein NVS1B10_04930 [Candidatus Saccharimonadales bacterium]
MGLFSKFKSSMNGGVQVHVQAPSSVPSNQVIQVAVNVTSASTQTINSVKAELKAVAHEQGLTMGDGNGIGVQQGRTNAQTVANAESKDQFTISPGETKTVNLQLYLSGGAQLGQIPNVGGAIGGVLQTMASVAQKINHVNYTYTVHGSVDVQGHSLSPSDKQDIQILPASEVNQVAAQPQVESIQPQSQPYVSQPIPTMPMPIVGNPTQTQPNNQNIPPNPNFQ